LNTLSSCGLACNAAYSVKSAFGTKKSYVSAVVD